MKGIIILILMLCHCRILCAQIVVSRSYDGGATWVDITIIGGATQIMPGTNTNEFSNAAGVADQNDGVAYVPLPFNFNFLGTNYTSGGSFLGVSTNGFAYFSNVNTNASKVIVNNNSTLYTNGVPNNVIAPYFDDLALSALDVNGRVLYQTTGAPGNQIFTLQYQDFPSFSSGNVAEMNFGFRLFEGTNRIQFLRGPVGPGTTPGANINESASSGLGGTGSQFYDLWTGSNNISNGTVNSSRWGDYGSIDVDPLAPAPLPAGNYNIPSATYPNVTEFLAALNGRGIAGPVTGQINGIGLGNVSPFFMGPISGTSPLNTITLTDGMGPVSAFSITDQQPTAGFWGTNSLPTFGTMDNAPVLGLIGSDFVTVNRMTYTAPSPSQSFLRGIGLWNFNSTDGATNNTISRFEGTFERSRNSIGVYFNLTANPTNASGANSFNKVYDSFFGNLLLGGLLNGNSGFPDIGNDFRRNRFGANYIGLPTGDIGGGTGSFTSGLQLFNQNSILLEDNIIQNLTSTGAPLAGLFVDNATGTSIFRRNTIRGLRDLSPIIPAPKHAIVLFPGNTGTNVINFHNNMVSDITSAYAGAPTATVQLVDLFTGGGGGTNTFNIFFNSFHINGSTSPNVSSSNLEHSDNSPTINLWGNSYSNETINQAGAATHSNIITTNPNNYGGPGSFSNYNNFFIPNTTNGPIAIMGGVQRQTLANWTAGNTGNPGSDPNSITQNPLFVSPTDLHIQNGSPNINAAIPGATGVTNDRDGQLRPNGANFDIGADEFYSLLPVGLLSFSGQKQVNGNLLLWTTVTESNNKGFEVERSYNGIQFDKIGFEPTKALTGNSDRELNYSFLDMVSSTRTWYRLKQIDLDDRYQYSKIVVIDNKTRTTDFVTVYPNPVVNELNLQIHSTAEQKFTLLIIDISGRVRQTQILNAGRGSNNYPIDVSRLLTGSYYLKLILQTGNELISRFIKP